METYTRLILSEREEISINAMQGKSIRSIAKKLNRVP
ncbi:MAG: helix-turn-helix domain-containing protein, partial [Candidatus Omnitrophica bacterium]|nr:helix-turn-helix domain-containing protein [Candidatus Omnitrophota bacterium]